MFGVLNVYLKQRFCDSFRGNRSGTGGEMRVERLGREHFARLAEDCGMSPKLVLSRLDALASAIRPAARKVAGDLSAECPSEVYGEIEKAINRHLEQVHA